MKKKKETELPDQPGCFQGYPVNQIICYAQGYHDKLVF